MNVSKASVQNAERDEELMERFRGGDMRAFRELLNRHEVRVYNYFLRSFGQPELSQDLTQEVFLRVVRGRDGFRRDASFATWMWRIVRNLKVDTFRRLRFRRHASLDAPAGNNPEGPSRLDGVADPADQPADRGTEDQRFARALREAIPQIEEQQREVFLLRQTEGLSFQEIAEVQGVNVNTVKSRMRYALEKLRAALAEFAPAEDEP